MKKETGLLWVFLVISVLRINAQTTDSTRLDLDECIQYALRHQPAYRQANMDIDIANEQVKVALADWLPQVNMNYNLQHYTQLPVSIFPDANGVKRPVTVGLKNTSTLGFSLNQSIFNRDVLLASRTANDVRTQARQNSTGYKIDLIANVSKAYYDVLLSQKRIEVLVADTDRLNKSLKDAYAQFNAGLTDKTDYKRAIISLNNSKAELYSSQQGIKAKYEYLKQQMGYDSTNNIAIQADKARLEEKIQVDTSSGINFDNRIEYQLLKTQQKLQSANLQYYKWGFLPSLSAFGNYNLAYQNDQFGMLYSTDYPNSYFGLTLAVPLFQGTKRIHQVRQAELQLKRMDWDFIALKKSINTEYTTAIAVYRANMNNYLVLKENMDLANDVYNIIDLQYKEGIKTYLEVIVAQSDLRTAQLNYFNALFEVLSSKIDVDKALGLIQ
jgi:outer membrane protein TolC